MIDINPDLTTKQKEALRLLFDYSNGISEVLYGGSAGGGKSFLGCLWLIICCLKYKESRWLMGRSKLHTLKTTTLKTFFEVTKKLGLKENEHFKYNQQNNIITFMNGSEIILKDLFSFPSDPEFDSLGSLEIAGAFIDECNQVSHKAKNIVMSRCRHKLDEFKITPKIFMSCNPARNWVYNEFYKKKEDGILEDYKAFIPALSTDNKFISKHYVTNLERQDEITKKRLLYGIWDYEDVLGLFKYDAIQEMFDDSSYQFEPIDISFSIDVARLGKDKTCILVFDGLNIIEIIELSKKRLNEQQDIINELKDKYQVKTNKQLIFDTDGVGGGLADQFKGCVEIVNNSKAMNSENYQNLKTQLYYKLAEKVNAGEIRIYNASDDIKLRLSQELQIIKRKDADQDGKLKITNKDEVKQAIGRSPDISDALAYRMYLTLKKTNGGDFSFTVLDF